jgi:hypothetical protein
MVLVEADDLAEDARAAGSADFDGGIHGGGEVLDADGETAHRLDLAAERLGFDGFELMNVGVEEGHTKGKGIKGKR